LQGPGTVFSKRVPGRRRHKKRFRGQANLSAEKFKPMENQVQWMYTERFYAPSQVSCGSFYWFIAVANNGRDL